MPSKEQLSVCSQAWDVARTLEPGRVVIVHRCYNARELAYICCDEDMLHDENDVMRIFPNGSIKFYEHAFKPMSKEDQLKLAVINAAYNLTYVENELDLIREALHEIDHPTVNRWSNQLLNAKCAVADVLHAAKDFQEELLCE